MTGQFAQGLPVLAGRGLHRRPAGGRLHAAIAPGHLDAGGQPLHVPLPGPGEGLVEVVHVKQHRAFGRGEPPEVEQVGIPAQLGRVNPTPAWRPGRRP